MIHNWEVTWTDMVMMVNMLKGYRLMTWCALAEWEQTSTGVGWGRASGQWCPLKSLVCGGAGSSCGSSPEKDTSSWEPPARLWSPEHVGARSLFSVNDAETTRLCQASRWRTPTQIQGCTDIYKCLANFSRPALCADQYFQKIKSDF